MAPARDDLARALHTVDFAPPAFDVYANATGAPTRDARATLGEQLTSPVRFADSLTAMAEAGVTDFVHVGPGDVTAGLAKRTVPVATTHTISTLVDVGAVAAALSVQ
jgi:[acyl-carrier-protein] S-malonyltransferase